MMPRRFPSLGCAITLLVVSVASAAQTAGEARGAQSAVAIEASPGLDLADLEGQRHSLDEWRGKVLLVNFWASWCAPCQAEIPDLVRIQARYGDQGLQILGVGIDAVRPLENVRRSLGINYPVLVVDPGRAGAVLGPWGNARRYVPYSVIVDRSGRVVHRQFGELDESVVEEFITPLL